MPNKFNYVPEKKERKNMYMRNSAECWNVVRVTTKLQL